MDRAEIKIKNGDRDGQFEIHLCVIHDNDIIVNEQITVDAFSPAQKEQFKSTLDYCVIKVTKALIN